MFTTSTQVVRVRLTPRHTQRTIFDRALDQVLGHRTLYWNAFRFGMALGALVYIW